MVRLVDVSACPQDMRIGKDDRSAFVDREDVAVAGLTPAGQLIFQNRVFLKKYRLDGSTIARANIRELVPDLGDELDRLLSGAALDRKRLIRLFVDGNREPVGYLYVAGSARNRPVKACDLGRLVSAAGRSEFALSYCGLYVADCQAYTVKVNPSYQKIAFLPESDLVGRNLRELEEKGYFSQSVTLQVLSRLKREAVEHITLFQRIITGKDVIVTGKPVYSEEGRLTHVLTFVQDLIPLRTIARKCVKVEERDRRIVVDRRPAKDIAGAGSGPAAEVTARDRQLPFVAEDPSFLATVQQVVIAARYDSPVLLLGETGVGKDLLAAYMHRRQNKGGERPFVTVNCSAIPKELLESELFGYDEGAFSGAKKGGKPGLFEQAQGGTLFLNEISEISLDLQAKLLSALDEGRIRRIGGSRVKQIKVRVICATNRDLFRCVEQGRFRDDLYYRINVLTIEVPPLRKRPADILPLICHFMRKMAERYGISKYLSAAAQDLLLAYSWPGNVRELKNLVERFVVFSPTEQISIADFPPKLLLQMGRCKESAGPVLDRGVSLKEAVRSYEKELIREALRRYGKVSEAARRLGIDPTTLSRKMKA